MMKLTPQQKSNLSPLGRWLLEYVRDNEITLTEVARQAGLSLGALRSLVINPARVPKLETCLQISRVTGTPLNTILSMAGLRPVGDQDLPDLAQARLLRAYSNLHDIRLRSAIADLCEKLVETQSPIPENR